MYLMPFGRMLLRTSLNAGLICFLNFSAFSKFIFVKNLKKIYFIFQIETALKHSMK